MEDNYVGQFWVFNWVWGVLVVMYWMQVDVKIQFLVQCYVQRMNVVVDWGGQRIFDSNVVVMNQIEGFSWQLDVLVIDVG